MGMAFSHTHLFGFGGNYGYNLRRQFDKCTRVAKFALQGAWMHLAQITAPRIGKVYPKECE
jgi:hypothetical protein